MRDRNKKSEPYRYRPPAAGGSPRVARPEDTRERYYLLIRLKLSMEWLRRVSWVNIAVFLCVLGMFFLGGIFLPKPEFSQVEKRDLAKLPEFSAETLFSGEYTRGLETYFADTFPLREWFVSFSAVIDEAHGIRKDDVRIVHNGGMNEVQDVPVTASGDAKAPAQPETDAVSAAEASSGAFAPSETDMPESSAPESPAPSEPAAPQDDGTGEASTISNGILVYKGRAMSLFGGLPANGEWYAQVLNAYHEELPDVQIYNMVIPTAGEFYVPERYRDLTQSQKAMIDHIYSTLDPAIKQVDAWTKLAEHTSEYIYFRTDHHWTGLGAYYAYTAFCEQAGFEPLSVSDFETRRLTDFIGTMYAQTQDSTLLKEPDYVDYYLFKQPYTAERFMPNAPYYPIRHNLWGEYAQSPNSYSVFLQGDFPLIQVHTGIPNGRKIMVVKESFGNAFAPFLINHYEEVYIVDQRYFQLGAVDFIREHGINELVFANNTFAACTPYHIRCIDNLRHQVFVPPAPEPAKEEPAELKTEEKPKKQQMEKSSSEVQPDDEEEMDDRERSAKKKKNMDGG
ncbi:DHHW family protein [Anaerotruncus rubiinfantis]|uniref:DHHW family protein n=1 Tax=Anaerotruncus rubiinfantis TaxID=1720200 RepID=UPI000835C32D|nr:DHHW family protein [Anaerotruncus rubiinfantis]